MMKWIGRILFFGFLVVIIFGVIGYFSLKATQAPSVKDAPYAVQVFAIDSRGAENITIPTRYYYVENLTLKDGQAVMDVYWTYDGMRYHKENGIKEIPPPYDIIRRKS